MSVIPWTSIRSAVGVTLLAIATSVLFSGCGGGGGGVSGTGVSGVIVDVGSEQGIGGMVVTIGNRTATSQTPDGRFTITGLTPGHYQVTVRPSETFVPVPGPALFVDVVQSQMTQLAAPFLIIDRHNLPPAP